MTESIRTPEHRRSQYNREVGEWIRKERKARGISQAELAAAIGVSQNSISFWERGVAAISAMAHDQLRHFFDRNPVPGDPAPAEAEVRA
jgi:ribosome-binding protein aMBF1 (putative translation factor)